MILVTDKSDLHPFLMASVLFVRPGTYKAIRDYRQKR